MKKLISFLIILYFYTLYPIPCLFGDFEDTGAGARSVSMGNAACGLSDDAFGIYYNPAGLGYVRQGQFLADYGRFFVGLNDGSNLGVSFVAVAVPFFSTQIMSAEEAKKKLDRLAEKSVLKDKRTKEAILLKMKSVAVPPKPQPSTMAPVQVSSQIPVSVPNEENVITSTSTPVKTEEVKPVPVEKTVPAVVPAVQEEKKEVVPQEGEDQEEKYFLKHWGTAAFGWRNFALQGYYQESAYYFSLGKTYKERLSYGLSLKLLSEKYTIDEYMKLSPVFNYGTKDTVSKYSYDVGVLYNIMPRLFLGVSALDINQPDLGLSQSDNLSSTIRIGLAWRQPDIKWAIDGIYKNQQTYTAFGLERILYGKFGLRGGLTFGGKNYFNAAFGAGYNFDAFQVDYAFSMPLNGIAGTMGSHRMTMVYRFGSKPKEELEPGSLEYYYSNLEDEVAELKRVLANTKSEKKKLEEVLIEESTMRIRERMQAAREASKQVQQAKPDQEKVVETREVREISHLVRPGETLQTISKKYYKDERFWSKIYEMNKENIGRGGVLKPNQVIIIPPLNYSTVSQQEQIKEPVIIPIKSVDKPAVQVVPVIAVPVSKPVENGSVLQENKPVSNVGKRHTVQPGENLQSIAKKYYNDAGRWKEIYKANKDKVIGGQVSAGQELVIP